MKYVIAILLFFYVGISFAFQNEPDGFRGLKWKDVITKHKNLVKVTSSDRGEIYKKESEKLQYEKIKLESVFYYFSKQKFVYASMTSIGEENNSKIMQSFKNRFGKPAEIHDELRKYIWRGKKSVITLDCLPASGKCTALYMSTKYEKSIKK